MLNPAEIENSPKISEKFISYPLFYEGKDAILN